MSNPAFSYRIYPLGDSALTIDFGNCIDEAINREVIARFHQFRREPLPGMIEVVPAYSSLSIYYDITAVRRQMPAGSTVGEWIRRLMEDRLAQPAPYSEGTDRLVKIPVCYEQEFAPDSLYLSVTKNISPEELAEIHVSKIYKVYMLGFLPGFAYMGGVDEKISIPRKPAPVNMIAGCVGIAGRQTGVYPMESPGGWQIIGRTPLKLFDAAKEEPALLRAGDRIQFYAITTNDFYEIKNSLLHEMDKG